MRNKLVHRIQKLLHKITNLIKVGIILPDWDPVNSSTVWGNFINLMDFRPHQPFLADSVISIFQSVYFQCVYTFMVAKR